MGQKIEGCFQGTGGGTIEVKRSHDEKAFVWIEIDAWDDAGLHLSKEGLRALVAAAQEILGEVVDPAALDRASAAKLLVGRTGADLMILRDVIVELLGGGSP